MAICRDFSSCYGFLPLTLCATNTVFFADFAPPKARNPLIRLLNSGNGRERPLPQHSRPERRFRDGPWQYRNRSREGVNWSDHPAMEDRPRTARTRPTTTDAHAALPELRHASEGWRPLGGAVPSNRGYASP